MDHLRARLPLVFVLCAAALVYGAWIWWGLELPTRTGWAPDAIRPNQIMDAWQKRYSDGWSLRYPPLHIYLLTPVLGAVTKTTDLAATSPEAGQIYFLLGGALTLTMGLATIVFIYLSARELRLEEGALWAAAFGAFSAPTAFYAKTTNLDVPFVFWFSAALYFWLRWLRSRTTRDAVAFALLAVLSVGTKDQALALFILPVMYSVAVVIRTCWRETETESMATRLKHTLLDRRLWVPLCAAAGLSVLIFNPITNLEGVREHVRLLLTDKSVPFRMFESSPGGLVGLAAFAVAQLAHSLGWPALILGIMGAGMAMLRSDADPRWRLLVLPVASYSIFFVAPIGYTYDRFWLPIHAVLALWIGMLLSRALRDGGFRRIAARGVAAAALAVSIAAAVSVDMLLACDGRPAVRAWMNESIPRDASIYVAATRIYSPNLEGFGQVTFGPPSLDSLRTGRYDYVITTSAQAGEWFPSTDPRSQFFDVLSAGQAGFAPVFDYLTRPRWSTIDPWELRDVYERLPGTTAEEGRERPGSNLDKIAPRIRVYAPADRTVASLDGVSGSMAPSALCLRR